MELKTCRVCLETSEMHNSKSIFESDPNEDTTEIGQKICDVAGITISQSDEFPEKICSDCYDKLIIAYNLRLVCQKSDQILKEQSVNVEIQIEFDTLLEPYESEIESKEDVVKNIDTDKKNRNDECKLIPKSRKKLKNIITDEKYRNKDSMPIPKKKKKLKKTKERTEKNLKFICETCGHKYTSKYLLTCHVKSHTDIFEYECEICYKKFRQTSHLSRHMRTHTGEKPFLCTFCGRAFSDLSTRIKHERSHTDERPYPCVICGKSFRAASTRNNHMSVHSTEKPFRCDLCDVSFAIRPHFMAHCKTVTHKTKSKGIE